MPAAIIDPSLFKTFVLNNAAVGAVCTATAIARASLILFTNSILNHAANGAMCIATAAEATTM